MSEVASTELPRGNGDKEAFAEVERWMALIREISLEQGTIESGAVGDAALSQTLVDL